MAKNVKPNTLSENIRIQLWDTAGQERFKSLIPSYTKDANMIVLVYDVNDGVSFKNLDKFLNLI